jgi:hypothetical protein
MATVLAARLRFKHSRTNRVSLESDYLKAVIPRQARVLGQRLRPLTLGHVMVLTRYGSPFVTGERQPQFGDLCFAVWVCKRNWKELLRGISDLSFKKEVLFLRWFAKLRNKGKAILVFIQYLTQAMQQPNLFFNKVEGAKPTSMNNLHYMKMVLVSKMHKTSEEAMNTPFGEAIYDIAALGEGEGACGFVTDSDLEALEVAKKMHERRTQGLKNGERN